MDRSTAWVVASAKIAVSAMLLVYVIRAVGEDVFSGLADSLRVHVALMVVALFAGVFILGAVRWQRLTLVAGSRTGFADAFSLTLIGHFFNQVLPTSIGGDAVRAWHARNVNMDLTRAAATVLCDRAAGLCVLALLILALFPAIGELSASQVSVAVLAIAAGCLLGAALFVAGLPLFARYPSLRLLELSARLLRDVLHNRSAAGWIVGCTLVAHVLTALAGYLLVVSYWPDAPAVRCAVLFLTALLVSTVPISYAGWGLREVAVVYFLRDAGVNPDIAFKVSVVFGALLAVSSLPGAIFWAARTRSATSQC